MEREPAYRKSFEDFLVETEAGLRHALIGLFGSEDGRDAAAQAPSPKNAAARAGEARRRSSLAWPCDLRL